MRGRSLPSSGPGSTKGLDSPPPLPRSWRERHGWRPGDPAHAPKRVGGVGVQAKKRETSVPASSHCIFTHARRVGGQAGGQPAWRQEQGLTFCLLDSNPSPECLWASLWSSLGLSLPACGRGHGNCLWGFARTPCEAWWVSDSNRLCSPESVTWLMLHVTLGCMQVSPLAPALSTMAGVLLQVKHLHIPCKGELRLWFIHVTDDKPGATASEAPCMRNSPGGLP